MKIQDDGRYLYDRGAQHVAPDAVRRQHERRIHRRWRHTNGRYGLRCYMVERPDGLTCYLSEEYPARLCLDGVDHLIAYENILGEVNLSYTWDVFLEQQMVDEGSAVVAALQLAEDMIRRDVARAFDDLTQEAIDEAMMAVPKVGAAGAGSKRYLYDG